MKLIRIYIFLFMGCISMSIPAYAQSVSSNDSTAYQSRNLYLPALGSTPETGFLFGGVVVRQFKFEKSGPETRSSSLFASAIYTLKNQILVSFFTDILFPEEKWVITGSYYGNYYPDSFWGVGPFTKSGNEIPVIYTEYNIEQDILRQVRPAFFLGPYFRWNKIRNINFKKINNDDPRLQNLNGLHESTSFGLGLLARIDKRNSNMTPTRNHYIQFSFLANPSWLGTTYPYTSFLLDARKYFDLKGDGTTVLALQGLARMVSGSPSFIELSIIGGDRINRGYYTGRFRDKNSAQFQAEIRQNIIGRFGFAAFAATGEVWNRFENLSIDNYKWSTGIGLRFNLNKKDPTNLRIDYGIGKNTSGFYIQFGEAF